SVGLVLVAAVAAAQSTPYAAVVAVDSAGSVAGPVSGDGFGSYVAMGVDGQVFVAGISPTAFTSVCGGRVRFDGPNCTGNAYMAAPAGSSLIPRAIITPPDHVAWIPHPTDTAVRTIGQLSELEGLPDARGCLAIPNPGSPPMQVSVVPALK